MQRREFITLLGGAPLVPLAARAQDPGRTYRIGALHLGPRNQPFHDALYDELRQSGFAEGKNLWVDRQGYGLRVEQLADHASEIVKAQVDIILCVGDAAVRAAQQATKTIPILGLTDDMVGSHFARSLAKPGGNTTGVSIFSSELDGKRQEILMEAVPGLRRMAALADADNTSPQKLQVLQEAARARGVELLIARVTTPEEIAGAIDTVKSSGAAALNVLASPLLFNNRHIIMPRVATLRLPTIYQAPEASEGGGLIGYGPRLVQIWREILARQLIKLLRGMKPTDVPVEQPDKFELVINLKAAKEIGLEIPASFVLRADKLIE
jgi:putative tryptophan/tyrosine transport system substrate-binding protein